MSMSSLGARWVSYGVFGTAVLLRSVAGAEAPTQRGTSESADEPPELAIVPPRLEHDPGVVYPERALNEGFYDRVEVSLILELNEAGNVERATLETPRGHGFDEAALEAAALLRFVPALRDGHAVASRIRFVYSFETPTPLLTGRVVDARTGGGVPRVRVLVRDARGAPKSVVTEDDGSFSLDDVAHGAHRVSVESAAHVSEEAEVSLLPGKETHIMFALEPLVEEVPTPNDAPVEVTVRGERRDPAIVSYSQEEVRRIPGAFGDPFRAIETLPGVVPIASGLPFYYVRGAPPGNVGYFLDGVRVPYLYHVGAGPSVLQPTLVRDVALYSGGYPARFGGFAGGIVSASTVLPKPKLHGHATLRLFDAGGMLETPFADGKGTALVGGRYAYTGALLSLAAPEIHLDYRDYQARLSYELTPDDRLSVFSFGAYDLLKEYGEIRFGSEFYRVDLRHDHAFDRGNVQTALTLGFDRTHAGLLVADDPRNVVDYSVNARTEAVRELSQRLVLRAGAGVGADIYRVEGARYVDTDFPAAREFERVFPPRTDHTTGIWFDLVYDATPRLEVVPGVRADLYGSGSATALGVDPRLSTRFLVTSRFRLLSTLGIAHQRPSFVVPLPGIAPALGSGLQRTLQTSAGAEVDLDDATTASGTLFYNAFFDTTDAFGAAEDDPANGLDLRSDGEAIGAELFLRRRLTKQVGGFVAYTLSRSLRRLVDGEFASAFDRTHVANVALSCDLGRGWTSGARGLYYTGTPVVPEDSSPSSIGTSDVAREPSYFRLDLRLEKRWVLGRTTWIAFVAEFLNATLNKETWPGGERMGPISIPSLGVEAGF